jgi:DNA polymerase-3 subunit delta
VYSALLNGEIREDKLLPCYFFYGEETYLADQFVDQLRAALAGAEPDDVLVSRFYLEETRWPEIIDTARTVPFLFQQWRVLVVRIPERKGGGGDRGGRRKDGSDAPEQKGTRFLGPVDQSIIKDYCGNPAPRTTLVMIMTGKVRKTDAVVKFFASLPKTAVLAREVKPFYPEHVKRWAERKAQSLGKSLTEAAKNRLYEIVGSDLRLLDNEIDKLAVFVGDRLGIDEDDVDQATAWLRSFEVYELDDALTSGDFEQGAAVLNGLVAEGESPEQIVGKRAAFLRGILLAQTRLQEKERSRDEIFQEIFPYILKSTGDFYRRKMAAFFGVVDALTPADLNTVLRDLGRADLRLKTTDASPRTVLEIFLEGYCLLRRARAATSRGSRPST